MHLIDIDSLFPTYEVNLKKVMPVRTFGNKKKRCSRVTKQTIEPPILGAILCDKTTSTESTTLADMTA